MISMRKYMILLAAAMMAVACQKAETESPQPNESEKPACNEPATPADTLPEGFAAAKRSYPIAAGTLRAYDVRSEQMKRTLKVDIWTPDGYAKDGKKHPVLYMHDGQNVIKKASMSNHAWEMDKVVTRLGEQIAAPIVVMIYCSDATRNADYMPANWWSLLPEEQTSITVPGENTIKKANSREYIDFIAETLKPWVDKTFATESDAAHTFVGGSSMGALVSVYAVQYRPDIFGGAMALSYPSLAEWWDWQKRTFSEQMPAANSVRLYIDAGTGDLDKTFFPYFDEIGSTLTAAGWDEQHLQTPVFPGANHSEKDWAARLDVPLTFLLGTEK